MLFFIYLFYVFISFFFNLLTRIPYFIIFTKDGDRIKELLEAMKALPDFLETVVKREVSQLPSVLRGLMKEIQPTRGQNDNEVFHSGSML